jgi:hypothetical protein
MVQELRVWRRRILQIEFDAFGRECGADVQRSATESGDRREKGSKNIRTSPTPFLSREND